MSTTASMMNCVIMFRCFAPIARRMPISRIRSVTETSTMFMMPMPAAISVMELATGTPKHTGGRTHGPLRCEKRDAPRSCGRRLTLPPERRSPTRPVLKIT